MLNRILKVASLLTAIAFTLAFYRISENLNSNAKNGKYQINGEHNTVIDTRNGKMYYPINDGYEYLTKDGETVRVSYLKQ